MNCGEVVRRGRVKREREGRVPGWRQRYRGRGASWPFGCWGREDWAQRGGIYTKRGPGGSEAVDGLLEGHGRENEMMSSSPIRGPSRAAKACAKRV